MTELILKETLIEAGTKHVNSLVKSGICPKEISNCKSSREKCFDCWLQNYAHWFKYLDETFRMVIK